MQVILFLGGRSKIHARVVVGMEKGVMFREVSSYKGSGIEGFHCIFRCNQLCSLSSCHYRKTEEFNKRRL